MGKGKSEGSLWERERKCTEERGGWGVNRIGRGKKGISVGREVEQQVNEGK